MLLSSNNITNSGKVVQIRSCPQKAIRLYPLAITHSTISPCTNESKTFLIRWASLISRTCLFHIHSKPMIPHYFHSRQSHSPLVSLETRRHRAIPTRLWRLVARPTCLINPLIWVNERVIQALPITVLTRRRSSKINFTIMTKITLIQGALLPIHSLRLV